MTQGAAFGLEEQPFQASPLATPWQAGFDERTNVLEERADALEVKALILKRSALQT